MPDIKIGVAAGVENVEAAIKKVTAAMNSMGAAVAKSQGGLKFEDTTTKLMARDLALLNKQFQQAIALSATLRNALKATGQSNTPLHSVDFSKLSTNPAVSQRMRDRAFTHAARGTSLDMSLFNDVDGSGNVITPPRVPTGGAGGAGGGNGGSGGGGGGRAPRGGGNGGNGGGAGGGGTTGGSWWSRRPQGMGTAAAQAIGAGIGGTGGNILQAGIAGGPAGALLAGVTATVGKLIGAASEGMDLARQQDASFESIFRSMGSLGTSFEDLRKSADIAGKGLGILPTEFAKLEADRQSASSGVDRSPGELARNTATSAAFSKAYGIDPTMGVGAIGMMQRSSGSSTRELVVMLANAIQESKGNALPVQVMQMMQGFMSATSRLSLSDAGGNNFGAAFGSMLGIHVPGMTPENAAGIIGQANSAIQGGTGAGEAGWNMTARSALATGKLTSAVQVDVLNQSGLFGNRNRAFGADTALGQFMHREGRDAEMASLRGGSGGDTTNLDSDMSQLKRDNADPWNRLSAIQRTFGLNSINQAAALGLVDDKGQANSLGQLLDRNKISFNSVNAGGLQTLGDISGAKSMKDLQVVYNDRQKDLSDDQKKSLQGALGTGNLSGAEDTFAKIFAGMNKEATPVSVEQDINATLQQMKVDAGRMLYPQTDLLMKGMGQLVSVGLPLLQKIVDAVEGVENWFNGPKTDTSSTATQFKGSADPSNANLPGGGTMYKPTGSGTGGLGKGQAASAADLKARLLASGVSEAQADAFLGNAMRESSLSPTAENQGHYGLLQWDKTRQANFAKLYGHDMQHSTAQEQMAFALQEVSPGGSEYKNAGEFWAAKNAGTAGVMYGQHVIRPGHYSQENPLRFSLSNDMAGIKPAAAGGFKPDNQIIDTRAANTPSDEEFGAITVIPPAKIPAKDRDAAAASSASGSGGAGSSNLAPMGYGGGNLNINLTSDLNVKSGDGKVSKKNVTSTFSVPSAGQKTINLSH
jgi:hypothetical protein